MALDELKSGAGKSADLYDLLKIPGERGVVCSLAEVRKGPTLDRQEGSFGEDLNILCTFSPGEPVVILKEEGEFFLVCGAYYRGWILKKRINRITASQFENFRNPFLWAVVTEPLVTAENRQFDMGTVLPFLFEEGNFSLLHLPDKEVRLPTSSLHIGFVPYERSTLLSFARKYIGVPYGWGNAGGGVDCSGLIQRIFRCFGVFLPRNVAAQRRLPGVTYLPLWGENARKPEDLSAPALLFAKGHVLLLTEGGKHPMVLHAPHTGSLVLEEPLTEERRETLLSAVEL